VGRIQLRGLADGGGKEKPWKQRLRVKSAWGKREGVGSAQYARLVSTRRKRRCIASSARASARHGRSVQDVSFASGRGHGSVLGMPPFAQVECLFRAPVEQAVSQANAAVLTSTEGMGGFSLPGAVRRFARAQIGLVSQAELVLRMGGPCAATKERERERERERENARKWETRV